MFEISVNENRNTCTEWRQVEYEIGLRNADYCEIEGRPQEKKNGGPSQLTFRNGN
jgi:hypothetical protein